MIRVLLVDDQELVRSGFRIILESEPDIEIVGEAATGAQAVELAAATDPDVICMDVEMPVMNGIEASRRILGGVGGAGDEGPAILVLTTFGHERYLFDALAAGVRGFLLKTSRAEQLIDAVRALAAGNALLGPDVTQAVIARVAGGEARAAGGAGAGSGPDSGSGSGSDAVAAPESAAPVPVPAPGPDAVGAAMEAVGLTEREREVLLLVAQGRSNGEIAAELFLGEATVKTHVSNTLQKLGVRDRIQAVVWMHTRA